MNPQPGIPKPKTGRGRFYRIAAILAILLAIGAVITVRAISKSRQAATALPLAGQYWTVKRGPLVISLMAAGTIKAKQSTEVKCLMHGDVKINWIVDEGTVVKAGDKLVELECSDMQQETIRQRIMVTQAQSEYEQANKNLDNQKSKNFSDLLIAKNELDMATLDLEKYVKGDYQQKIREAESDIKLAEAELKRARGRLAGTQKLLAKGYVNRGELEADTLAETKCTIELDKASSGKDLLEKYEYKREVSSLETKKKEAEEELRRITKNSANTLAIMQILVESAKARLEMERFELTTQEEQLKNAVIYAPTGGMVVYAQNEYGDDSLRIRQGAQIHRQQKIIDLPDFSAWRVEARVHESMIQQVKLEQQASISIDAFQGQSLTGTVGRISMLPDSSRWFMPDTKEYLVNLDVTTTTLPLKPGMSAKTELLLDSLKSVLTVPVQAINTIEGKSTVYVNTETGARPQPVEVGLSNDRFAEIKTGLHEGDMVLLTADNSNNKDGENKDTDGKKDEDGKEKNQSDAKDKDKAADGGKSGKGLDLKPAANKSAAREASTKTALPGTGKTS